MGELETPELKSIGISTALILTNIGMIWVFLYTPLRLVNSIVFSTLIIGMIFYGILLTAGNWIGKKGIKEQDMSKTIIGTALLQFAYGMFGAGILNLLGTIANDVILLILGTTLGITLGISFLAALLVYWTDRDFSQYQKYSSYAFIAAFVMGILGSFSGIFALITFCLVLLGFLLDLIYELWQLRSRPRNVILNGFGIYVAFMGVFVQILRLVVESYLRSR
jgi:hypothetical protein